MRLSRRTNFDSINFLRNLVIAIKRSDIASPKQPIEQFDATFTSLTLNFKMANNLNIKQPNKAST